MPNCLQPEKTMDKTILSLVTLKIIKFFHYTTSISPRILKHQNTVLEICRELVIPQGNKELK